MGAAPVETIHGHTAKICALSSPTSRSNADVRPADERRHADGIDWSRKDAKQIITCSLDQSFKVRRRSLALSHSLARSHPDSSLLQSWRLGDVRDPLRSVTTSSPIWRARWLPFGDGVLSLPQRSDHALSVWSYKTDEKDEQPKPVARFEGAREGVREYVWRTRGGEDLDHGASALHLSQSLMHELELTLFLCVQTTASSSSSPGRATGAFDFGPSRRAS